MKTICKTAIVFLSLFALLVFHPFHITTAQQVSFSPSPTYDPLEEPPLPPNPSEYELGRNLYWHWCMPCHGDRGQGLTDEFRAIWEPDHQNCWERGCHCGKGLEEGFPIPTVVPGIVDGTHLIHFAGLQELSTYLEKTHPPQSPGILKTEEYHAIAVFVFTMNRRQVAETPLPILPAPTMTFIPERGSATLIPPVKTMIVLAVLVVGIYMLVRKTQPNGPYNL